MKHSYASKILKNQGIQIFANGVQILNHDYKKVHPLLVTNFKCETEFINDYLNTESLKSITDYEELRKIGFKLIKFKCSEYFKGQKVAYSLVRINHPENNNQTMKTIPREHSVSYNIGTQALQGVGRNFGFTGRTEWKPIKQKNNFGRTPEPDNIFLANPTKAKNKFNKRFYDKDRETFFNIKEGVLGITQEGYICTLPSPVKTDPYFIMIIGGSGQGKSLVENNIEDILFHKYKNHCCNVNDIAPETQTRCLEWDKQHPFNQELNRFGEVSVPKPAVYLHPTTNERYDKIHYLESGYDVSLPLRQLLSDEDLINYNSDWDMKGTSTQMEWRNLIRREGQIRRDGLAFVRSYQEAEELIDSKLKEKGMCDKAKRIMSDIFNTNMTDVSSKVASKWILKYKNREYAGTPWVIAMISGLFPYLNTSKIRTKELWFALWLRYVIEDVLKFAKTQNKVTNIFLDEIEELLKYKVTQEIVERAIRECRKSHVGITMVNHNFKYTKNIYTHSTGKRGYKFIFNTAETELISQLKKEGLSKSQAEEIPELQQFQCYAFGHFILYDQNGNSFPNKGGKPLKLIKIKPPNCRH